MICIHFECFGPGVSNYIFMFQMCSSNRARHYVCVCVCECSVLEKSFGYWRLFRQFMPNLF